MKVEFGNNTCTENYRDPESEDPDLVRTRPYPGEHVTTLIIPNEQELEEAFRSCLGIFALHSEKNSVPVWVESDNSDLEKFLKIHYKIKKPRPKSWGKG